MSDAADQPAKDAAEDHVTRFLFEDLDICGALVNLSGAWRSLQARRNYPPRILSLVGEMAAVTALVGSSLKAPGRLTFQARGEGPVSLLVVDCEYAHEQLLLRGMARHEAQSVAADLPVAKLLGDGRLLFSMQSDASEVPYQSFVPLQGGSMTEIFEHFLAQSAQQPARLWLNADANHASGLFLQTLPASANRETPVDADGWNRIQQLAATVRPQELLLPATTLLSRLFPEETIRVFDPRPTVHYCPRDEDKVRSMLASLGRNEIMDMLAEQGEIVIVDDMCNHEYRFGAGIVEELFPSAGQTLH